MSFPVARVAPNGFRGVIRRAPMAAPAPMPHTVTVGILDVATLFGQQRFEQQAPRILCDENGQLYELNAGQLKALPPHQLPRAIVNQPERGYRPLFAEPGYPLVVPWNEFRTLLATQIAHPEKLRDGHRVPVRTQIYEVMRPQSLGELAESITGDRARVSELTILTDRLMSLLGLSQHLPPPMRRPHQQSDVDTVMAHERVIRMQLMADPTSATATPMTGASAATTADAPQLQANAPRPRADKESIPQAFLRPWEFKKSREDVLYELTRRQGVLSAIRSGIQAMTSHAESRLEHRCWEVLRSGRSLEDQLWSVPPPRRGLGDREVREWAARTLAHAGYNVQTMLLEWEIFWRRKLG